MAEVDISVYGIGHEIGHIGVSKEAFDFWDNKSTDELVVYLIAWSDDDLEELDFEIPTTADFLRDPDTKEKLAWHDASNLIDEYWRIGSNNRIGITVDGVNIYEGQDEEYPYLDDTTINLEHVDDDYLEKDLAKAQYIITFESIEKGNFVDSTINIDKFDVDKLKFYTVTDWTGDSTITDGEYDGDVLENENAGDSSGKGYGAYVWEAT
jgi:hypothetical protein